VKIPDTSITLADIMCSRPGRDAFFSFLDAEYATESISFWEAVQRYEVAWTAASPEGRKEMATEILNEFIKDGSPQQVNVSHEMRRACMALMEKVGPISNLFNIPAAEIFKLMGDAYRRFMASEGFVKLKM
jgi:hypothetical protein